MPARKNTEQTRQHIIDSTDTLMYEKGFNNMSFTEISQISGVSKGNLYYYFKTKEDVLKAVIDHRVNNMKKMLFEWESELPTPLLRLKRFVQIVANESGNVIHYGCPMGSLNTELAKSQSGLQKISKKQFDVFKNWLKKQFKILPSKSISDNEAGILAIHLLVRTQGIAVIAQAYSDKKIINREIEHIYLWLEEFANG